MSPQKFEHLDRAPIAEAVLDIRVAADMGVEGTKAFAQAIADRYPKAKPIYAVEAKFSVKAGQPAVQENQTTSRMIGQACGSPDGRHTVQARVDGFSVNHLQPYRSWEVLRDEAAQLWPEFQKAMQPRRVTRLALRYINRLTFPIAGDISEHLLTLPAIGQGLPRSMKNFFMRVEIPFSSTTLGVIKQVGVPPQPGSDEHGLMLDIDAVSSQEFAPDDSAIWSELDRLRDIKNICFFKSLAEHTWSKYR